MNSAEVHHVGYLRVLLLGDWPKLLLLMLLTFFIFYVTWIWLPCQYLMEAAIIQNHEQERANGRAGNGDPAGPMRCEDFDQLTFFRAYDIEAVHG